MTAPLRELWNIEYTDWMSCLLKSEYNNQNKIMIPAAEELI